MADLGTKLAKGCCFGGVPEYFLTVEYIALPAGCLPPTPTEAIFALRGVSLISLSVGGTYTYEVGGTTGGGVSAMKQQTELRLGFGGTYERAVPAGVPIVSKSGFALSVDFKSHFMWWELPPTVVYGPDPGMPPPPGDETPPAVGDEPVAPDQPVFPSDTAPGVGIQVALEGGDDMHDEPIWTRLDEPGGI
jgi:hypothetical protein